MKKEVGVAIFIGLTFGVIITVGLYRARLATINHTNQPSNLASPSPEPTAVNSSLVLNSPEDETIQSTKSITVAGTTTPQAYVVIFVNNQDYFTTADNTGHFSIAANLEAGSNIITTHTIDEDGKSITEERTVIYSTAGLEENPAATTSSELKTDSKKT